jgi:predicted dehydrogenase/threonine dehydrogenase-like Zn-dependent dehydrogenase
MLVEFGQANLLTKARQHPDKMKMVLDKAKTDGLLPTLESVHNKLSQPVQLGYCNVGMVLEVGLGVSGFAVDDQVISNGKHAEVVCVPANLCAKVPSRVPSEQAAFTVLGAVALQAIRLLQPTLGEAVVVTGLGLVGLMSVQLLRAHGCRVLGIDPDPIKLGLAQGYGAETVDLSVGQDPIAAAQAISRGRGVDGVLVAAATESNEPIHQAALMCRTRGRIVLVGVAGLDLSRDDFFKKEIAFQVSSSYGPGRYDPNYEEKGYDYPVGFVRWTAQRNFEAVLDTMAAGRLDVSELISHRFDVRDAGKAYDVLASANRSLGILLEYPSGKDFNARTVQLPLSSRVPPVMGGRTPPTVSFIGSGNYAQTVLIPAFSKAGAHFRTVGSMSGVTGTHAARRFGFAEATTDNETILADPETNTVVITTRHDSHAVLVLKALEAGKNVFVEKPLCLTLSELEAIDALIARLTQAGSAPRLMVGFNRRFAPQVQKIKSLLASLSGPRSFVMTVNAGAVSADHWTQDSAIGGGRIVGEGCHFIDLLRFLAGAPVTSHHVTRMKSETSDTATLQLVFADGSIGAIHYFSNGSKRFPKERLEVFACGRVLQLDNYRKLTGYGWPGFTSMKLWRQDKGQQACAAAFLQAVRQGTESPIPFEELREVSRLAIDSQNAL